MKKVRCDRSVLGIVIESIVEGAILAFTLFLCVTSFATMKDAINISIILFPILAVIESLFNLGVFILTSKEEPNEKETPKKKTTAKKALTKTNTKKK